MAESAKRKQFMKTVLDVFDILDPTGANSKHYKEKFSKMSDAEFDKFMKEFRDDEKYNFYLETIEYERDLTIENIHKAADYLKIPLYEHVALPYINEVDVRDPDYDPSEIMVTPNAVPVGYIHIKRMPQTVHHKNSGSTNNSKRNAKTGQVTGDDKNGRNTDVETFALSTYGAEACLKELMGFRADDLEAKKQAYASIERDGYVRQEELISTQEDKVAINTLDTYYTAMGFCTNIVSGGYTISYAVPKQ